MRDRRCKCGWLYSTTRPAARVQVLGVIITLAILLTFIAAGCGPGGLKPEAAAGKFFEYWQDEDYEAMYEMLDAASQERYRREQFSGRYTNISSGIGLKSLTYELKEVLERSNERARVAFTVKLETSTVGKIPLPNALSLTRESRYSKWLVSWGPELIFPELTDTRRVEVSRLVPKRGEILDRYNRALASYRFYKEIGAVPGRYEDQETLIRAVADLLELNPASLRGKLEQSWVKEGLYVPLAVLSPEQEPLLPQLLNIRGVMVKDVERRFYPAGEILGHVTGYLGEISAEELAIKKDLGFYAGDLLGKAGLEAALEPVLAGTIGFTLRVVGEDGNVVALIANREVRQGADVLLSIDLKLQQAAKEALGDKPGAVVALDPQSGELLALATNPGFDPNWFITGQIASRWQAIVADPFTPLVNRSLEGLYPPGSIFKAYTAAVALQEQRLDPDKTVVITGESWQPSTAWGNYHVQRVNTTTRLNLYEAMKDSDNIYFAQIGLAVGAELFERFGERFGFGERVPFILPVAVSSLSRKGIASEIQLADSSFGQGEVLVTPLQMALLYSAFATGGDIPLPRLWLSAEPAPGLWKAAVDTATAEIVHKALVYAVHGVGAPAGGGAVEGFTVAGKSGTAQLDAIEGNICWYVTYGPAAKPEIVVAAVVEGGRWATEDALPVARSVLEAYLLAD